MARVHVIGAGLAGLASAVALARAGWEVVVYETAGQAGGRCRSFYDDALDRVIDNGNHLLMSANSAALAYLEAIGSVGSFWSPDRAAYPFFDLGTGERWTVVPTRGAFPRWIFDRSARVAGTSPWHYLPANRRSVLGDNQSALRPVLGAFVCRSTQHKSRRGQCGHSLAGGG
ncbi:MAG: FAD-dependent oxidoreductase, partial [Alphaproteobacteria bacterium]|nr:FAD-dependent oxidoreductase [Alphaproteobacteria bacterium]